jgi:hypothetical protein
MKLFIKDKILLDMACKDPEKYSSPCRWFDIINSIERSSNTFNNEQFDAGDKKEYAELLIKYASKNERVQKRLQRSLEKFLR